MTRPMMAHPDRLSLREAGAGLVLFALALVGLVAFLATGPVT